MKRIAILLLSATGCFIAPERPVDGAGGDGGTGDGGPGVPPNIAFVTSAASDVGELNNPIVADALCMQLAQNAQPPLVGTYRAWMSSADEPAQNRFAGARGWVRVDDWTQPSGGSARIGDATRSNASAFGQAAILIGCSAANVHVYCAEMP